MTGPPGDAPGAPPGLHRRTAVNTLANVRGTVVMMATGFVLPPVILHHLGSSGYGLRAVLGALAGYGALNLGIGSAVVTCVAEHDARGEADALSRVVSTAAAMYAALAAAAGMAAGNVA